MTKPKQKVFWLKIFGNREGGKPPFDPEVSAFPTTLARGGYGADICPKDIKRLFGKLEPGLYRVPVGKPEKVKG